MRKPTSLMDTQVLNESQSEKVCVREKERENKTNKYIYIYQNKMATNLIPIFVARLAAREPG